MIHYLAGDATDPAADGPAIVAHVCNNAGHWGKGFVLALSRRWPAAEAAFRRWHAESLWEEEPFALGGVQLVPVEPGRWVANMVAQHGTRAQGGVPPIRYGALETCLHKLLRHALARQASLHMPRIGCGLAGGKWERVGPLLEKMLGPVEVYVYDLPEPGAQRPKRS